ncbi:hypothetical protein MAR_020913 [Mya arenaria]|nr:uncharacterized protein LOC128233812 [Mya arenaria]XP_052806023.1 uncharacterized protein LOC128235259 [Mya arenaria]WAR05544.1 hypothetical protein MAR_020913 [Mya arenaria]
MAGLFRRTLVKLSEHNLKGVPYEVPENWVKSTAGMTIKSTMHHYILLPLHFFTIFGGGCAALWCFKMWTYKDPEWRYMLPAEQCKNQQFPEQKWPETRPEI